MLDDRRWHLGVDLHRAADVEDLRNDLPLTNCRPIDDVRRGIESSFVVGMLDKAVCAGEYLAARDLGSELHELEVLVLPARSLRQLVRSALLDLGLQFLESGLVVRLLCL